MIFWLKKTRSSSISFSIRTYNSVSNSCPKITRMMAQLNEFPLSIEKFNVRLEGGEPMIGDAVEKKTESREEERR
ncbi:hypothetical protein HN873_002092 [Arachis hypogaea]